jgi:hypothetical protein
MKYYLLALVQIGGILLAGAVFLTIIAGPIILWGAWGLIPLGVVFFFALLTAMANDIREHGMW